MAVNASKWLLGAAVAMVFAGCSGRPALLPNHDPMLRKNMAQMAADAAKRHPMKTDLPHGGQALARAEVEAFLKIINIVNLSDQDWSDVEMWVNDKYELFLPRMERKVQKSVNFQMLFDDQGNHLAAEKNPRVYKINLIHDGKNYDVPVHAAE